MRSRHQTLEIPRSSTPPRPRYRRRSPPSAGCRGVNAHESACRRPPTCAMRPPAALLRVPALEGPQGWAEAAAPAPRRLPPQEPVPAPPPRRLARLRAGRPRSPDVAFFPTPPKARLQRRRFRLQQACQLWSDRVQRTSSASPSAPVEATWSQSPASWSYPPRPALMVVGSGRWQLAGEYAMVIEGGGARRDAGSHGSSWAAVR